MLQIETRHQIPVPTIHIFARTLHEKFELDHEDSSFERESKETRKATNQANSECFLLVTERLGSGVRFAMPVPIERH